nr:unnamed protein product [Callosobruchus chinensis]
MKMMTLKLLIELICHCLLTGSDKHKELTGEDNKVVKK